MSESATEYPTTEGLERPAICQCFAENGCGEKLPKSYSQIEAIATKFSEHDNYYFVKVGHEGEDKVVSREFESEGMLIVEPIEEKDEEIYATATDPHNFI